MTVQIAPYKRPVPPLEVSPAASTGLMLERVTAAWHAALRAALMPLALTPAQFHLLSAAMWLGQEAGTGARQSDIAALAATDPVTTSAVLRALELRGLVDRVPHATDRRAKAITVTIPGAMLATEATRVAGEAERRFLERGMPEFGRLGKALKKGGRGTNEPAARAKG